MKEGFLCSGKALGGVELHCGVDGSEKFVTPNSIFNELAGLKGRPSTDLKAAGGWRER